LLVSEISSLIDAQIIGDKSIDIQGICSLQCPKKNHICYISNQKYCKEGLFNEVSAILIGKNILNKVDNCKTILLSKNPEKSFTKLLSIFNQINSTPKNTEKNKLPENLTHGLFFSLGENNNIGDNCIFGNNVTLEDNVSIGSNVTLGHNVVVCSGCKIGNNSNIGHGTIIGSEGFGNIFHENNWIHIPHIGFVVIENNVSIGSNCSIDRGTIDNTIIKSGVIIDNLVHIAHNVCIGEKTAIAAKVGIAGSCNIGKRNMIGGMVGIVDHINTADDVVISATSTVNKDIKEPGTYTGIMPISKHSSWKRIAVWITKIDKISKLINLKKI